MQITEEEWNDYLIRVARDLDRYLRLGYPGPTFTATDLFAFLSSIRGWRQQVNLLNSLRKVPFATVQKAIELMKPRSEFHCEELLGYDEEFTKLVNAAMPELAVPMIELPSLPTGGGTLAAAPIEEEPAQRRRNRQLINQFTNAIARQMGDRLAQITAMVGVEATQEQLMDEFAARVVAQFFEPIA